ncbi:MAG TPA: 4Fe-4S dicluster domain-containing protein [Candidatus Omnitrophota bacterium]|nr:4Fe-4S dicluster domain-containing protein [Candidatus Omnitrophota bacterium]HPN88361.1 4Fe-4S dicluster domain-containing protein [Candidatus Omnitrophota bacterium]
MLKQPLNNHARLQWILAPIVLSVIIFGWKFPLLGLSVPLVMIMGFFGGFINGRFVCGNLCPRGGFYDRIIAPISPKKHVPVFLRGMPFRIIIMILLMGLMIFQISRNPSDIYHWGRVFWFICLITTLIGVGLSFIWRARSWCAFCPMGTMQYALGPGKKIIEVDDSRCIKCLLCEKTCPMELSIIRRDEKRQMDHRDCLKCGECIRVCPKQAIHFAKRIKRKRPTT